MAPSYNPRYKCYKDWNLGNRHGALAVVVVGNEARDEEGSVGPVVAVVVLFESSVAAGLHCQGYLLSESASTLYLLFGSLTSCCQQYLSYVE